MGLVRAGVDGALEWHVPIDDDEFIAADEHVARLAHGRCVMGTFTKGRGTVFNAGSVDWAYGLDGDPLVQQVTANVLARLGDNR